MLSGKSLAEGKGDRNGTAMLLVIKNLAESLGEGNDNMSTQKSWRKISLGLFLSVKRVE